MASLSSIQNKLLTKVFNKIGSVATHYPYSSQTTDKWGDSTITYGTSESITYVPYNFISKNKTYEPFGDLKEGELDAVFKHDATLTVRDKLVIDNTTYYVKQIEKFPFSDGNLAFAVRLYKSQ